jgi:TyrR family helix-turn-helix protein
VFYLRVPPLRERREDILPLIELMLRRYSDKYGVSKTMDRTAAKLLEGYPWYGNIRELDNFVQKVFIDSQGGEITVSDINRHSASLHRESVGAGEPDAPGQPAFSGQPAPPEPSGPPEQAEGEADISGMDEASLFSYYKEKYGSTRKIAQACGLSQSSVARRLRKYGLNGAGSRQA